MRATRRKNGIAIAAALVAILTMILLGFTDLGRPVVRTVLGAAVALHRTVLPGDSAACPAAAELEGRLQAMQIENAKLLALAAENAQLLSALAYRDNRPDAVVARVLYQAAADQTDELLVIDRGRDDGLAVGQPVIVENGVIVGKIVSVGRHTARVLPLTDSRSRLAVTLLGAQTTIGVLEGDRGLSMAVRLIPQSERVSVGDSVVTSGLEPNVPRGLVVGTIETVDRPTQEPFQTALIRPFDSARYPLYVQILPLAEAPTENDL